MIEYRVWDVENSKMIYRPVSSSDEIFISPTGQIWKVNPTNPSAVLDMISPDKFIILKFTGNKDKNGKNVYEGDILKWKLKDKLNGQLYIKPVYWSDEDACFWVGVNTNSGYVLSDFNKHAEIIGNIYEDTNITYTTN